MEHILTAMQKSATGAHPSWRVEERVENSRASATRLPRDVVWASLPQVRVEAWHLAAGRIVTAGGDDPARSPFDMMRTRVLHHLRENGWTTLAITSPTPGGGKSVVALNLAFSLANREDCRVAVLDLDLRSPRLAALLGTRNPPSMEAFLTGRAGLEDVFSRPRPNLAVACNSRKVRLAAELLQGPDAARTFREMKQKLSPDVVICDLPPMLANDDMMAFLPNVDCAILVAEAEVNTLDEVDVCEHELAEQTNVLGVVLNKCRHGGDAAALRGGE